MTRKSTLRFLGLVVLAAALVASGCAKKQAAAPPATTPPPAETPAPAPQPPETPPEAPQPTPAPASWQDAFFDFDKSDLRDDAKAALDGDAKALRDHADVHITIEGHCDERGTPEYNLALGERRAAAARDYLVAAGIDASRIEIISYGEERPFATGSNEEAWAQNRRAHIVAK
jgi:peptidoglycan-associated lipoprotein